MPAAEKKKLQVEWLEEAWDDITSKKMRSVARRITDATASLTVDNYTAKLEPYRGNMAGYYKLRVGSYRVVCTVDEDGNLVVIIVIAVSHRSASYEGHSSITETAFKRTRRK